MQPRDLEAALRGAMAAQPPVEPSLERVRARARRRRLLELAATLVVIAGMVGASGAWRASSAPAPLAVATGPGTTEVGTTPPPATSGTTVEPVVAPGSTQPIVPEPTTTSTAAPAPATTATTTSRPPTTVAPTSLAPTTTAAPATTTTTTAPVPPVPTTSGPPPALDAGALVGHTYVSDLAYDDGRPRRLGAGARPAHALQLTFATDTAAYGSAGCNGLQWTYTVEGAQLVAVSGAHTLMACVGTDPNAVDLMAQEAWFSAAVEARPALVLDGPRLLVFAGTTVIVFEPST